MADEPQPERRNVRKAGRPAADDQVNWGQYVGVGLQIGVGVALGLMVGHWLDNKYQWGPWGTLVCTMLGLAGGMYLLIKDAMRINKD